MTQTVLTTLAVQECCNCGVAFGMPEALDEKRQDDGEWFWCPNGHRQHYSKPRIQVLKDKLAASERATERQRLRVIQADEQREATERSLRSTKGHLTRARRRIVHGTCPYCHRHFKDVARHMTSKHPKLKRSYSNWKGKEN